ncbi:uncharacterized protein Z518_11270 [Rhinocladiella mackenziei CBS 650.93]|uniref:RecA family profile 1 domain-containing protein n=1 Tax=Rhinocladiella mackenziei CBS 650.93 TaxID=1442369 RepID=A0A0D2FBS3_9EURO|nr:uncharacterized protein Z518_11270 [Rhinocladiella mackenziei CBS 650.93]KIW99531.1 hypothetical protein Z518_11270 [Rhinocladiella mackenziei CBS 650.93]
MSDLLQVLPDFNIKPYTHLFYSLEKNDMTIADLVTLDPKEIARRCPLPSVDVQKLVADVIHGLQQDVKGGVRKKHKLAAPANTASETEKSEEKEQKITRHDNKVKTLDGVLDQAFNGGFQPGHITEIVGESAVGKTQFVLGLLLSVQLPPPRGLGKGAIYVSTEAPLNTHRLREMLLSHPEYENLAPEDQPSLDRIHTIVITDLEVQEHVLRFQLPIAVERYKIGLIVLDSVAANFRAEHETRTPAGLAERAAELSKLGNMLRHVAIQYNAVVVVTNQVSDRFDDPRCLLRSSSPVTTSSPASAGPNVSVTLTGRRSETQSLDHQQRFFTGWGEEKQEKRSQLKNPALGLAWANQISARIVLKMECERQEYTGGNIWRDQKKRRTIAVVFAPWAAPTYPPIRYEIGQQGIVSITGPDKSEEPSNLMDQVHADLLDEALWATEDDDEFP